MIYVKINDTLYPATVTSYPNNPGWDSRDSKSITVEMEHAEADALFVDGAVWSVVDRVEVPVYETDANGMPLMGEKGLPVQTGTEIRETETDFSDYDLAGELIDHRNGKITAKMGKHTAEELLAVIMGGK